MTQMPKTDSQIDFENAIKALEAQAANLGAHLTMDSAARQAYTREIATMADGLRRDAVSGKIIWAQAALKRKRHAISSWKRADYAAHQWVVPSLKN